MNDMNIKPKLTIKDRIRRGLFMNRKSDQYLTKSEINTRGIIITLVMLACFYGIAMLNQALYLEGIQKTADGTTFYSFLWHVRLLPSWLMPSKIDDLIMYPIFISRVSVIALFSIFWFAPLPVFRIFGKGDDVIITYPKMFGSLLIHIMLITLPYMLIMRVSEADYLIENSTGIEGQFSDLIKFYLWGQIHPVQAIVIILIVIGVGLSAILYVASFFLPRKQEETYEYTVVSKKRVD